MTQILHLSPHLGGGLGKVLSNLVIESIKSKSEFEHIIICLEKPEKLQFVNEIIKNNGKVIIHPSRNEFINLIEKTDIVQLNFTNNPVIFKYLCTMDIPPIRLLTWSHNNNLYNPTIPQELITESHIFLFTSPCSLEKFRNYENVGAVFSSGGFKNLPVFCDQTCELKVGYFGETIFSKLHPNCAEYINMVDIPNFKVKMIGKCSNKEILEKQSDRFEFVGYVTDTVSELSTINVLAYLLNPEHYGTTENTLLEAMSMGIVPIVLNNPPESYMIKDDETGFIVNSLKEFREIIKWLIENPKDRQRIGNNASQYVRENFSVEKTESEMNEYYKKCLNMEKRIIDFKLIFGETPVEWFLSCQQNKAIFKKNGTVDLKVCSEYSKYMLFEKTKGSVFHFSRNFPNNRVLKLWATNLKSLQ